MILFSEFIIGRAVNANSDFIASSYFMNVLSFASDEGQTPSNTLNVSIPIIDDELPEHPESFVVTLELKMQYGNGVQIIRQSSFINITGSDGKWST